MTKTRPECIIIKPPALGANNLAHGQDPKSVTSKGSCSNKERQPSRKGWNGFEGERETAELYGGWGTTQPSKSPAWHRVLESQNSGARARGQIQEQLCSKSQKKLITLPKVRRI